MFSKKSKMMSRAGLGAVVASLSLMLLGSANATSYFSLVGGASTPLPTGTGTAGFDPGGWTSPNGINGGTSINVFNSFTAGQGLFVNDSVAGPGALNVNLEFTYEGTEAGYTNVAFGYNNSQLFVNHGAGAATIGDTVPQGFTLASNPALLPFVFQSITGGTMATNGGGVTDGATPTAIGFLIFDAAGNIAATGPTAYLFFDDSGAGPDKDFDDMVVKVRITSTTGSTTTPLPGALPLFVSGLGAMGLIGWRRKRNAARAA